MTLEEAIFYGLSSNAAVIAVASDREFPVQAPQGAVMPYVVWQTISAQQINTHDKLAELEDVMVQFSCYANNYTKAYDLGRAVRAALEGNVLGNGAVGRVISRRETDESDDTRQAFRVDLDISFFSNPNDTSPALLYSPPSVPQPTG